MWKNKIIFKIKVTVMIYQTLTRRKIIFSHTTTMPLTEKTTIMRMELLKTGNGNPSQMI